jgi:hypothetical protein
MLQWKNSKYRYLTLALFLPGFAFSIYKTFQVEVVPIKEYQRARVEFAKITPPVGDRLEDHNSGYQTYRAFSRYSYDDDAIETGVSVWARLVETELKRLS